MEAADGLFARNSLEVRGDRDLAACIVYEGSDRRGQGRRRRVVTILLRHQMLNRVCDFQRVRQAISVARTSTALAVSVLLASACLSTPTSAHSSRIVTPGAPVATTNPVLGQAAEFMGLFELGDFADQWSLLSPLARAQWPSAQARAAMLTDKFAGSVIDGYTLGEATPGASWTSPENLASQAGLWQVPVGVEFSDTSALEPAGVASSYLNQNLFVSWAGTVAAVVGEGPASLDAPILLPSRISKRTAQVPILMYHRVAPYPNPALYGTPYAYRLDYGLTVDPAEFSGQVDHLAANGYQAISLTRLADFLLYGLALPSKPVIFTFDDGLASPLEYAVPVLRAHGFTAVFFITTGLLGWSNKTQQYLRPDQVTQLVTEGFWAEDHTFADNVSLWGRSPAQLAPLVLATRQRLEALTGAPVQFLAYTGLWPYPQAATAGPRETMLFPELEAMGYLGGAVDARQDSDLETSTQLWQLPRVRVNPREALATFQGLL